jgi:hypothetical protein
MMRGSGKEAGPPPSVQLSAVEEKLSGGLGEESDDGAVLADQLGTPRGRCDEHSSKFSLSYETKV